MPKDFSEHLSDANLEYKYQTNDFQAIIICRANYLMRRQVGIFRKRIVVSSGATFEAEDPNNIKNILAAEKACRSCARIILINGQGCYLHPKSGRKYVCDPADSDKAIKGMQRETPHVDVHRMVDGRNIQKAYDIPDTATWKQPKRKYPLGDELYVPISNKPGIKND